MVDGALLVAKAKGGNMAGKRSESGTFQAAKVKPVEGLGAHGGLSEAPVVPHADLEQVVAQLNAIGKAATLRFALDVGAIVVNNFYDGDLDRWRKRDKGKDTSLRRLARHPNLPMSPPALYRCVAIYELCERIDITSWKHISTGHIRLVLPLPPERQLHLLSAAEADRWSVRQLDAKVETEMRRDPTVKSNRGGVSRFGTLRKMIRRLELSVAAVNDAFVPGGSATFETDLSPESRREAVQLLHSVVDACKVVETRLCSDSTGTSDAGTTLCSEDDAHQRRLG
jgi:hypothetical protein